MPYLAALGVSHVYLSPYFKARPGSLHGYDIVEHNVLNPEIGDRADLDRLCAVLRDHGMTQLVDIVPNHVGVLGAENPWWQDVLENGRAAQHAEYFDIDWDRTPDELHGKLLIPVLGEPYGTVLERGGLQLVFEPARGEFALRYGEHRFPLDPRSYAHVLGSAAECVRARVAHTDPGLADAFESLGAAFRVLPKTTETAPVRRAERQRDQARHKRALAELCARSPELLRCVEEEVARLNGRPGDPASFDALHALIAEQVFRLASWRMAADDINYRRFADVNDLAALRMEDPAVFEASHRLLLDLIGREQVGAVRVDHPDGLCNPEEYFARLQRHAAQALRLPSPEADRAVSAARTLPLYLVVEKITEASELLPRTWPIAGTTGYGFANLVKGLFIDARAEAKLTRGYSAFLGERLPLHAGRVVDVASGAVDFNVNNPVPVLASIAPASKLTGDDAFTLTVTGTNFVNGAVVRLNGSDRATTFVDATQLTAQVSAADLQSAGAIAVTVFNQLPGGGTSGAVDLNVSNPAPVLASISPVSGTIGGAAFTLTVNGSSFVNGSVVKFNGSDRVTTFVSSTQLTAAIVAADISALGIAQITVFNPAPGGFESHPSHQGIYEYQPVSSSLERKL